MATITFRTARFKQFRDGFGGLNPRDLGLYVFAASLVLVDAVLALTFALRDGGGTSLWGVGVLGLVALLAERQSVRLSPATEISVTTLPFILAAVAFGPLAAMIVGAVSLLGNFGAPHLRWVIWTSSRAFVGALAGLAASAVTSSGETRLAVLFAAVAAAALADTVGDLIMNAAILAIRGTGSVRELARSATPVMLASVALYVPVVALLVYAYHEVSPLAVLLFLFPAVAAQWLFVLYKEQRHTSNELEGAIDRLERANLSFATALVATLDARDRYTAGHSAAVAVYARDIAARMALSHDEQQLAHLCGLVHDIGKIGLPAGLLEKPGPLTLEERRIMEAHAEIGERILEKVEDYQVIAHVVRHHHERVDGFGYPDGLRGEAIPLLSRIIAVADAYDAMTSDRPYRDAMPSRVARLRLAQAVESQFDTSVVAAFEAILAAANEDYRSGRVAEESFAPPARYDDVAPADLEARRAMS